jgi:CBS domain-containing protein
MVVAPTFRAYFMGLWSVMVGVFLLGAATNVVKSAREPATAREAMSAPIAIEPDWPISRFVDELLPLHRHATFPVARAGKFLGILSLEDLKKVPREQWRARKAGDVMRAVNSSMFVRASAAMSSARELMQGNGVGAVAVIDELGNLIGFLRRPQK